VIDAPVLFGVAALRVMKDFCPKFDMNVQDLMRNICRGAAIQSTERENKREMIHTPVIQVH